jgi:hypothetical protein
MHQARRKVMREDSYYEELEQVFDRFPNYNMKFLLGDVNAKAERERERENIFKPKIGNESTSG